MLPTARSMIVRLVVSLAAAAAVWTLIPHGAPVHAQGPLPVRYPLRLTPARVAALTTAALEGRQYVPGEVLVRFRDGVPVTGQQRALFSLRSRPSVAALRWSGAVAVLGSTGEPDAELAAATLRLQPEVLWAEPNYLLRPNVEPNDPAYATFQWNMRDLDMPQVWDINPGGSADITVAVIDTGITSASEVVRLRTWNGSAIVETDVAYMVNPDLDAARLASPVDLVFWDGPVVDFEGHGSHVGGTVGQNFNNGLNGVGIAHAVRIMPVKACVGFWDIQFAMSETGIAGSPPPNAGGCPVDAVASGVRYAADNGAKVINLSLGGFGPSETMREAMLYAIEKGAFLAIASGNSFEDGNPVEYPANYASSIDGAMSVGATGRSRTRAYYSGTASGVEIVAPGGSIRDGGLEGLIWQAAPLPPDSTPGQVMFPRFDRYVDVPNQGTSMASPHVAGIAALIMSQGVTSPAAVEALIKATALDLGPAGRDDDFGHGFIQPRLALRGFGIFTR